LADHLASTWPWLNGLFYVAEANKPKPVASKESKTAANGIHRHPMSTFITAKNRLKPALSDVSWLLFGSAQAENGRNLLPEKASQGLRNNSTTTARNLLAQY
jgi:hypothetical protein